MNSKNILIACATITGLLFTSNAFSAAKKPTKKSKCEIVFKAPPTIEELKAKLKPIKDRAERSEVLAKTLSKSSAVQLLKTIFTKEKYKLNILNEGLTIRPAKTLLVKTDKKTPSVNFSIGWVGARNAGYPYNRPFMDTTVDQSFVVSPLSVRAQDEFIWTKYERKELRKQFSNINEPYVMIALESSHNGIEWGSVQGRDFVGTSSVYLGLNRDLEPIFIEYKYSDTICSYDGDDGCRMRASASIAR